MKQPDSADSTKADVPVIPGAFALRDEDIFSVLRRRDVLVHHPYESFTATVEHFLGTAIHDPNVIALKIALARIEYDNPIVQLLVRAAEAGKQVVCLVEEQVAEGDKLNRSCIRALETAGVYLCYRSEGMATHARLALLVRKEAAGIRCYAHIGSGTYHSTMARQRTDLGLFTSQPEVTRELVSLFHALTGGGLQPASRKLFVAPFELRERLVELIDRETSHQRGGSKGRIVAQMNRLDDPELCQALCRASVAGVRVDLIVSGECGLRPRTAGVSENIRIRRICGRFQEHARVCYFRNAADTPLDGTFLFGSADWTPESLDGRVEVLAPIEDRYLRALCVETFQLMLEERSDTEHMQPDGRFVPCRVSQSNPSAGVQQELIRIAKQRATFYALQLLGDKDIAEIELELMQPHALKTPWLLRGNQTPAVRKPKRTNPPQRG